VHPHTGAPASEQAITIRINDMRPAAEFVLDYSPVDTTQRLLLHGNKGTWAIGRDRQRLLQNYPYAVPLTISSAQVSRQHALLRCDGRRFILEALLSSYPENPVTPVRVNDKEVTLDAPLLLHSGDFVAFSTAVYRFHILNADLASAPSTEQVAPGRIPAHGGNSHNLDDTWNIPISQSLSGR
jgi:hypothetical protein